MPESRAELCLPAGPLKRLQLKGVGGFAVAPGNVPRLAAFVAEAKGSPGFVGVWDTASLGASRDPAPLARRSFFRVRLTLEHDAESAARQLTWPA